MKAAILALAQSAPAQNSQQNIWSTFVMMGIIFVIFYFLLIRPQQKELKAHRQMQASLLKDDKIITSSGIHGRIIEVGDEVLTVEIADKVKIKLNRSGVATVNKPQVEVLDGKGKKR